MKITAVNAFAVAGPVSDLCFVKVETDTGLVGCGECSLPGKPNGVIGAVRDVAPLILGADPRDSEWCWQRLYRHAFWRGGPIQTSALSGIDVALWDIRGKDAELPIYRLLGGAVRDRIKLYANLGLSLDPGAFRARARRARAMGYRAFKIYPLPAMNGVVEHCELIQIVACCEAMRDELGEDGDFALDFHGKLTAAGAIAVEAAVRHTAPLWIEEPVAAEAPADLERCVQRFTIPIAVGERLFTRWGFRPILERHLAGIVQPDVSNTGGITEMMKIAAMAEAYGVAFNPHNPNSPLQTLASLHIAAHAQACAMLEHRHEHHGAFAAIVAPVIAVEADGRCGLPPGPGLGGTIVPNPPRPGVPARNECFRADGSIADW